MIGLIDYDFQTAPSSHMRPPNIEIMKLATYYKTEENIFCRIIGLEETELTNYDKIYFFSESEQPIEIPEQFKRAENIIFGGTYFTNEYKPFTNEIIDYTLPKIGVYKAILKRRYEEGAKPKTIAHILDDGYYRIYAGKNKLPIPPLLSNKRVFLYDKDFFYPDWQETIAQITERKISSIVRIHPIVCKKINDFFLLRKQTKIARTNEIILDLNIPLEEFYYLQKRYEKLLLAEINASSNVYITLGGTFKYSTQYYNDFIYKMNLLYSFWAKNIPIKIKYIYPKVGFINPIQHISLLIEKWTNSNSKMSRTIEDRFSKTKPTEEQIEYELIINHDKDSLLLFKQTYNKISRGRSWLYYGY